MVAVLLAHLVSTLAFFLSDRILISFREVTCLFQGRPFPAAPAANVHGSVWSVRKGFLKGADPADPGLLWLSLFFLLPAWTSDTTPQVNTDAYGLKKWELWSRDGGAETEELAGYLRPGEPLYRSSTGFPLDLFFFFFWLGGKKKGTTVSYLFWSFYSVRPNWILSDLQIFHADRGIGTPSKTWSIQQRLRKQKKKKKKGNNKQQENEINTWQVRKYTEVIDFFYKRHTKKMTRGRWN